MRPGRSPFIAVLVAAGIPLVLATPVAMGQDRPMQARVLSVIHGPVTVSLADPTSTDGHQPGDVRVTSAPIMDSEGSPVGRLDATLTTTAIDVPAPGDEVRIGVLVFSFGEGADQVVVEGASIYPAAGATIATGTSTVRPIVGGSGRFAGVTGWAESFHLFDGAWRHDLHLVPLARRLLLPRPNTEAVDSPVPSPRASPAA